MSNLGLYPGLHGLDRDLRVCVETKSGLAYFTSEIRAVVPKDGGRCEVHMLGMTVTLDCLPQVVEKAIRDSRIRELEDIKARRATVEANRKRVDPAPFLHTQHGGRLLPDGQIIEAWDYDDAAIIDHEIERLKR